MKVILMQDIKGVGKKDEVINASDGYARNFLFPKKMAVEANTENMAKLKGRNDSKQHKKDVQKQEALDISKKLENSSEMTQESSQLKSLHKAQPSCRIGFPFSHVSKSSGHILYLHVCFVFSYLFRTCLLLIATQITNII